MKRISKRNLARIVSFLSVGVLVVSLFIAGAVIKAKQYEAKAEAMYQKNLVEAGEYLADIDTVLLKGLYSKSAANQSSMCADLWRDAYEAKNAISSLPISDIDMEHCYTYLSKVAEYAKATEKKIASGALIGSEEHGNLLSIQKKSALLAKEFEKLQNIYLSTGEKISGGIDFSFAVPHSISSSSATSESLNALNKNLSNTPKLIYDGPYSDALNNKEPAMLQGKASIDVKKATQMAEKFLQKVSGTLKYSGKKEGNLPSYRFKKGNAYVEISVQGGKIVSFNSNESAGANALEESRCVALAQQYLQKAGYANMKCDYYESANHILVANFHAVQQQVNCYTDLIKVKVNRENGNICGFDALSYLTNHKQRDLRFSLSQNRCKNAVSEYLSIKAVKKALIPTRSEQEALCYEFRCLSEEGEELLVYINAATGQEQDILILQISSNGVLTK